MFSSNRFFFLQNDATNCTNRYWIISALHLPIEFIKVSELYSEPSKKCFEFLFSFLFIEQLNRRILINKQKFGRNMKTKAHMKNCSSCQKTQPNPANIVYGK